jgi:hypothetical protein
MLSQASTVTLSPSPAQTDLQLLLSNQLRNTVWGMTCLQVQVQLCNLNKGILRYPHLSYNAFCIHTASFKFNPDLHEPGEADSPAKVQIHP